MKVERKVIERGGGWFFYFEIKTVAAVVYAESFKSSVYAGFSVVVMVKLYSPPLFGLFFFQSIVNREF